MKKAKGGTFWIWLIIIIVLMPYVATAAGWRQSYQAGYTDGTGKFCGGSEIMHIVPHKGRLYAFNGYWEDERWKSPKDGKRQSAQVLRLDVSNAPWVVDLETGDTGLPHMKGNILKSVTFKTDKNGQPVNVNLLVAASQTHPDDDSNAISVFIRNDETGAWKHEVLQPGPRRIKCESCTRGWQGVRRVPRDIEIYHDPVTGIDRLFLLIGDPGILSGVYNEQTQKIEWDTSPEHPADGSVFPARPLGITEANGILYFSVGGKIFMRTNGPKPSWSKTYEISGTVNTDSGGIRGLTAVENPSGKGQSLIFVWTPGGESKGEIIRLDGVELKEHTETTLQKLFDDEPISLHGDARAIYSLGGYNRFFPVVNPNNGETAHLVGYEQRILGAHKALSWHNWYRGATFSIRTKNQQYTSKEVNGPWVWEKPLLIAPRAFAHSPFPNEKNVIYFGGFDTNFNLANNMAWIFKADVYTVLGVSKGKTIASEQLVCNYLFSSFDGGKIVDGSGKGLTGTLNGKVKQVPGILGKAASFDGQGSYIRIPNTKLINMAAETKKRSVALWFKADDVTDPKKVQVIFESGGDSRGVSVYLKGNRLLAGGWNTMEEESQWNGTFLTPKGKAGEIKPGQWYHVVFTLNGDEKIKPDALKIYLNGKLAGTGPGSQLWSHQGATAIGAFKGRTRVVEGALKFDLGGHFKGAVDELQIYNIVLTENQITKYYNQLKNSR